MRDRAEEWERLRADYCLRAEPIPGGARLWLRREAGPVAEDLVGREADCCGFLDLHLTSDGRKLRLDLTSPASEAGPVIAELAGIRLDAEGGPLTPGAGSRQPGEGGW